MCSDHDSLLLHDSTIAYVYMVKGFTRTTTDTPEAPLYRRSYDYHYSELGWASPPQCRIVNNFHLAGNPNERRHVWGEATLRCSYPFIVLFFICLTGRTMAGHCIVYAAFIPMKMDTRCSKVIFPNYSKNKPAEDTLVPPLWGTLRKNVRFSRIICSRCCTRRNLRFHVENSQHPDQEQLTRR